MTSEALTLAEAELERPLANLELRYPQEVFDMMVARARLLLRSKDARIAELERERDEYRTALQGSETLRELDKRRLAEAVEVVAMFRERIEARGEWDDGCFYHNRTSASELQEPLRRARSILEDKANG